MKIRFGQEVISLECFVFFVLHSNEKGIVFCRRMIKVELAKKKKSLFRIYFHDFIAKWQITNLALGVGLKQQAG